jgi:Flp pilus assembly protein TadG
MSVRERIVRRCCQFRRDVSGIAALEFALVLLPMVLLFIAGAEMAQAVVVSRNIETVAFTLVDLTSEQVTCTIQPNDSPTCAGDSTQATTANSITTTTLDTMILPAATAVMGTAPTTSLKMTITAVDIVNTPGKNGVCCNFRVRWSYQMGGGTLRGGPSGTSCSSSSLTQVDATAVAPAPTNIAKALLPPEAALGQALPNGSFEGVLIADVSYTYQPPLVTSLVSFAPAMASTRYMLPRLPGQVVLSGGPGQVTGSNGNSGQVCF